MGTDDLNDVLNYSIMTNAILKYIKDAEGYSSQIKISGLQKKENVIDLTTKSSGGCLLQFNKETGKITVIKHGNEETNSQKIDVIDDIDFKF